jgi:hypothetical protein
MANKGHDETQVGNGIGGARRGHGVGAIAEPGRHHLDDYVTNKSLDGLFLVVGEEDEKKKTIRTNPSARIADLLKSVFGK